MSTRYLSKRKTARQTKIISNASVIPDASSQSESLQRKVDLINNAAQRAEAPRPNNTGMPDNLKSGIENLSGFSMDDVRVHYNSSKPATVQALAYTQGTDIHVAPGQEKHLPHEAWHVAQQMAGRVSPTTIINGMPVNDNASLEHEADVMGEKAMVQKKTTVCQRRTIDGTIEVDSRQIVPKGSSNPPGTDIYNMNYNQHPGTPAKRLFTPACAPNVAIKGHMMKAGWDGGNGVERINQWSHNCEQQWTQIERLVEKKAISMGKGIYKLETETDEPKLWNQLSAFYKKRITKNHGTSWNNINTINRQVSKAAIYIYTKKKTKEKIGEIDCSSACDLEINP